MRRALSADEVAQAAQALADKLHAFAKLEDRAKASADEWKKTLKSAREGIAALADAVRTRSVSSEQCSLFEAAGGKGDES